MPTLITQTQEEPQTDDVSHLNVDSTIKECKSDPSIAKPRMCNNNVIVKSHTRRRKKTVITSKKTVSHKSKLGSSMDPASFAEIMRIQKEETANWKKTNTSNPTIRLNCEKWNNFWKNARSLEKRKKKGPSL